MSTFKKRLIVEQSQGNRPFAAFHSRGTKPPCWNAKVALEQDKQRKFPSKIMYAFCWSCPTATFASQHGGFLPRERKGFVTFAKRIIKCIDLARAKSEA